MYKIINKLRRFFSMFTFNKNSGCVKVWVTLIMNGTYTYEQVPKLLNLQDCVKEVLVEVGVITE